MTHSLGIVGCGRVTQMFHVKAVENVANISIKGICDVDPSSMEKVQSRCVGSSCYDSYESLLEDVSIDAIAVNTPPRFHEEMVVNALEAGKHVICEKPLSTTVDGCLKISKKRDETGLVVLPAHNYSFTPALYIMERLIREGRIGELVGMRVAFENNLKQYRASTGFRLETNNGLVEDVLPHIISVASPLVGHISSVSDVDWFCKQYEVCDNMSATLNTFSGVPVECEMSWTKLVPAFEVAVVGTEGQLNGEFGLRPYTVDIKTDDGSETIDEKGLRWYLNLIKYKHPSFQNQYRHFVDLIEGSAYPRVSITDELNILKTVDTFSKYLE